MSDYETIRPHIRSGDLILFNEKGPMASLIKWTTHSIWAHCGLAWVVGNRVFVLECRARSGVTMRPLRQSRPFDMIRTNAPWSPDAEEFALGRLQQPYSFIDAIRIGLNQKPSQSGLVCSVYAGETLIIDGFPIDITGLSPEKLASFYISRGHEVIGVI